MSKKKSWKTAAAVSGGLAVLSAGLAIGWRQVASSLLRYLVDRTETTVHGTGAATIGIIGGADGPTAIYVTGSGPDVGSCFWIAAGVLATVSGLCVICGRGKNVKKSARGRLR